jgi:hypothetical protein
MDRKPELERLRELANKYPFADRAKRLSRSQDALREAEHDGIDKDLLQPFGEVAAELSKNLQADEDKWLASIN